MILKHDGWLIVWRFDCKMTLIRIKTQVYQISHHPTKQLCQLHLYDNAWKIEIPQDLKAEWDI